MDSPVICVTLSNAENVTPALLCVLCALCGEASSEFTTENAEFTEMLIVSRR
jgi:hypothetical protein